MILKERLKQLKTGADRQASELGHENVAGAAEAFGRATRRALGNVVHDAGKMVLAFVPDDDTEQSFSLSTDADRHWSHGLTDGPDGYGYYQNGHHATDE